MQTCPNAVLVVDEQQEQDIAIVDLFNPVYDVNKKTLKYEIAAENATSIELLGEFGQTTLVIDHGGCCTTGGCHTIGGCRTIRRNTVSFFSQNSIRHLDFPLFY